ncbi:MAG: FAD binding domain-containing protein [Desulfomonilaceae bacterium]|nr:FAD binding domain-containing protein [Desulfomonilaceae bacterium]
MRLPAFDYELPGNLDEALELLNTYGPNGKILAGGTDLLVRMKQGLALPTHLISLKALPELATIRESEVGLRIGAAVRLRDILTYPTLEDRVPGFFEAVSSIGAPSIQHFSGTIGGNLCQDNRCQFYNQSSFFRKARQPCNKAGGKTCYAWEGGSDKCYSVCQSDAAPVLMAMEAEVVVRSKQGERTMPLAELYSSVGERPLTLADDEMLTEIRVPNPGPGTGTAFEKLTYRSAIDYAVLSAGALVQTEGERITRARLVIGAVSRAPLGIPTAQNILQGRPPGDEEALDEAARAAANAAEAFIANNMAQPAEYRKQMVSVMAKRALSRALSRTGMTEAT